VFVLKQLRIATSAWVVNVGCIVYIVDFYQSKGHPHIPPPLVVEDFIEGRQQGLVWLLTGALHSLDLLSHTHTHTHHGIYAS